MRIKDVFFINPSSKKYKDFINYIDTSSVQSGRLNGIQYLESDFPSRAQREIHYGDILYSSVRPNLRHYYFYTDSYEHAVASSGFVLLRCKEKQFDVKFGYYYLSSMPIVGYLSNIAELSQATFPSFSAKDIGKINLPSFELCVQHRIASILSAYDSLIENNTKRIRLLEKMAENLYKEWFVRFRFPGYEKAEMENGLPKGWKHGKLGDIVEFLNGFAFKSQTFCAEGKYSIVTIKNVRSDGFEGNNTDKVLELPSRIPKHCLLKEGDILLSLTGNIGRVCRVLGNGYLLNQRVAKLKSKNPLFCYCTFKSDYIYQSLNVISYGTAQLNLSPVKASKIKLPIPLLELLNNFEQIVKPIFAEIDTLLHQNTLLARRRDLLLPRLMSGKLEVKP